MEEKQLRLCSNAYSTQITQYLIVSIPFLLSNTYLDLLVVAIQKDVELIWSNCRLFNTNKGSKILMLLDEAVQLFQTLWLDAGLALADALELLPTKAGPAPPSRDLQVSGDQVSHHF